MPETNDALKYNIREDIGKIQLHTTINELKNWTDHVGYCIVSPGSNLNEIIFHDYLEGLHFEKKKEIRENI